MSLVELHVIEQLSKLTKYEPDFLIERFEAYTEETMTAGEMVDFAYFVGVTLDEDW